MFLAFSSLCISPYRYFPLFLSILFSSLHVLAWLRSSIAKASERSRASLFSSSSLSGGLVRHSLICPFLSAYVCCVFLYVGCFFFHVHFAWAALAKQKAHVPRHHHRHLPVSNHRLSHLENNPFRRKKERGRRDGGKEGREGGRRVRKRREKEEETEEERREEDLSSRRKGSRDRNERW